MTKKKRPQALWIVAPISVLTLVAACTSNSPFNGGGSGGMGGNGSGHGGATDATATNGATSTDGSTSNATSTHGATTTNGATTNGATTNGATTNGATTSTATTGNTTAATTASSTTGGGCVEPPGMMGMTAAHNQARANVSPAANPSLPPMVWNCQIAQVAQAYSQQCVFQHSMNPNYGENLYASYGQVSTPQQVVNSWVAEAAYYHYSTNTCQAGKQCGHYTQVVWRNSVEVGCGHTVCTTGSPFGTEPWDNWVCNYSPPGNYVGMKPY